MRLTVRSPRGNWPDFSAVIVMPGSYPPGEGYALRRCARGDPRGARSHSRDAGGTRSGRTGVVLVGRRATLHGDRDHGRRPVRSPVVTSLSGLEQYLHRAVLLLPEVHVGLRRVLQRYVVRGEPLDAERVVV